MRLPELDDLVLSISPWVRVFARGQNLDGQSRSAAPRQFRRLSLRGGKRIARLHVAALPTACELLEIDDDGLSGVMPKL
jgi:hypothetical protein